MPSARRVVVDAYQWIGAVTLDVTAWAWTTCGRLRQVLCGAQVPGSCDVRPDLLPRPATA